MNEISASKPLGKGEVESSILSGSTSFPNQINAARYLLGCALGRIRRNNAGTRNAGWWKIRGMRSRSVSERPHGVNNAPEWAKEDEDSLAEWLGMESPSGFLVFASTPVPTSFFGKGGMIFSWGYTQHEIIYCDSIADAVPLLLAWRKSVVSDARKATKRTALKGSPHD